MRFCFLTLLVSSLVFAVEGRAGSLSITADQSSYSVGDIVNLTIVGTIDATKESTTNIYVPVTTSGPVSFVRSQAQTALSPPTQLSGEKPWTVGGQQSAFKNDGSILVFDQIQGLPPGGPFVNFFNGTTSVIIATILMTADGPGTANFGFGSLTSFYGAERSAAGTSVTIVPEPSTVALMALGLFGLRAAGKTRKAR